MDVVLLAPHIQYAWSTDLAQCDTLRVQAHSFRDSFIHCATAANIFTVCRTGGLLIFT